MKDANKRNLRVQNNILNSFVELLKKNEYSEITVGDIANKASVTRSTFYRYFEDKEHLLTSGFARHIDEIFGAMGELKKWSKNSIRRQNRILLLEMRKRKKRLRIVMDSSMSVQLEEIIRNKISQYMKKNRLSKYPEPLSPRQIEYYGDMFANVTLGSIKSYLYNKSIDREKLFDTFYNLNLFGIKDYSSEE